MCRILCIAALLLATNADGAPSQPAKPDSASPIKVILPPRDHFDWVAYWANLGLVLVGAGGVIVAVCTLRILVHQTHEFKLQRITLQDTLDSIRSQVALMSRQADAMDAQNLAVRHRERARLTLAFPPKTEPDFDVSGAILIDEDPEFFMSFVLNVRNDGLSKAFEVRADGYLKIQPKETPFKEETTLPLRIRSVVGEASNDKPIRLFVDGTLIVKHAQEVLKGEADFYVFGTVQYKDVFEDKRQTPFCFKYSVDEWFDEKGTQHFNGTWENQSRPSL